MSENIPGDGKGAATPRVQAPVVIAIAIVLAVVGGYWLFTRDKSDYLIHRNLRILSSLAQEIDGAFAAQRNFVANYAGVSSSSLPGAREAWLPDERDKLLPRFSRNPCSKAEKKGLALEEHDGAQWLNVSVAARGDSVRIVCRQIALSAVLEPLLNREQFGVFDAVFLANANGRVLFSLAPRRESSTLLWQSAPHDDGLNPGAVVASRFILTDIGAMQESGSVFDRKPVPVSAARLRGSSQHLTVDISGDSYALFTHPYAFGTPERPAGAADTKAAAENQWIVGGVVSKQRLGSDVRAVSASKVALAIALCVLAICAWPFLRISLMTYRHPLTITDVALLTICSIVALSLVTLVLLDFRASQQVTFQTDEQLRSFAYKLEHDFTGDVVAASKALDELDRVIPPSPLNLTEADLRHRAAAGHSHIYDDPAIAGHPYFSVFSRIGRDGEQTYKVSAGARLPLVNVSGRRYFQEARDQHTWDVRPKRDGGERYPYSLEWVQSQTTGEVQAVVAKNSGRANDPVIALTTSLIDVENAIPPPGTSFAIIDEQGNVIYHPDEQRIGRENFFAEADYDRELRGAVLSRADDYITTPYWGEDQRMLVHPLANTQWTVVVFQARRLLRAMNVEALLLTTIALLANALPYLLFGLLVLAIRPAYRAPSLWPDPTRADDYGRLATVLALGAIAFLLAIYALDPRSMIPIAAALPLQAILSGYVLLHRHCERRTLSTVTTVAWMVVTAALLLMLFAAAVDNELQVSAKLARVRWLLIAFVVFESVVALKQMTHPQSTSESKPVQTSASIEALVAWTVASIVAVIVTWRTISEPAWWRTACVLLVILGAVVFLQTMIVSAKAAARRARIRAVGAAKLREPRGKAAVHLASTAVAVVVARLVIRSDFHEILIPAALHAALGVIWMSRKWDRLRLLVVRLIWSAVALTLLIIAVNRTTWLPPQDSWAEAAVPMLFFIALVVTVAVADGAAVVARSRKFRETFEPLPYPFSYRLAGVLTLLVIAVLPTLAYFKVGSRVEQEGLVKYAQLRIASALETRINRIGTLICDDRSTDRLCLGGMVADRASRDAFRFSIPNAWDTLWSFGDRPPAPHTFADAVGDHAMLARLIPQYSEDSVALHQLDGKATSDPLWNWTPDGRFLTLHRLVRLEPLAVRALQGGRAPHQQSLHLKSHIPFLFATVLTVPNLRRFAAEPLALVPPMPETALNDVSATIFTIVSVAACLALLFWIVDFISDRVLLLDVQAPVWIDIDRGAAIGDNTFLVRRNTAREKVVGEASDAVFDVEFAKIDAHSAWDSSVKEIDVSSARNIRVLDFEHRIDDPKMNLHKLKWLERVVKRDRAVLIVSEVTPSYVLGLPSTPKLLQRWQTLLGSFLWLTWDDVVFRREERARMIVARGQRTADEWTLHAFVEALRKWQSRTADPSEAVARWLNEESSNSYVLRSLSGPLRDVARQQVLDELFERAAAYYDSLWSACSQDEKLLLFHLARHGFVQSKNRRTLRRLMARGLVRRAPHLEIMSESFRAYVCAAGAREGLPALVRRIESEGPWRTLRVPIFVVIASFLLLLFTTQKDLLTVTTGLAAAMTTGLPVLVNLFGMFTKRRLETGVRLG